MAAKPNLRECRSARKIPLSRARATISPQQLVTASRVPFTTKLSGGNEFGYYVLVPTGEITHCDAMPGHKSPQSWIARANRRGCFIFAIVLVLTLLALAYVGFSANPINELNAIIPTTP